MPPLGNLIVQIYNHPDAGTGPLVFSPTTDDLVVWGGCVGLRSAPGTVPEMQCTTGPNGLVPFFNVFLPTGSPFAVALDASMAGTFTTPQVEMAAELDLNPQYRGPLRNLDQGTISISIMPPSFNMVNFELQFDGTAYSCGDAQAAPYAVRFNQYRSQYVP